MPAAIDAVPALRRAGSLGAFFAIDTAPDQPPDAVAWQQFSALLAPDHVVLLERVAATRAALGSGGGVVGEDMVAAVEDRVAASLWFLGWSARLVSPWLGAAVLASVVPVVEPDALWWQSDTGQPVPLAVRAARGQAVDPTDPADPGDRADPASRAALLYDACVSTLVEPLLEATALACSVSRQVLWGNVASAVAGAAGQLARGAPSYAVVGRAVSEQLLTTGALRGQGVFDGGRFTRRTCCLMYRLPAAALCADCVLAE